MRIDAASLLADEFRYQSSPGEEPSDEIALGRSGGVTGFYAYEDGAHAIDAQATLLVVARAVWHIAERRIAIERQSSLDGVRLVLSVPPGGAGTAMQLGVATASLAGVAFAVGDLTCSIAEAHVEELRVALSGEGARQSTQVSARHVTLAGVAIASKLMPVRLERIEVRDVSFRDGHLEIGEILLSQADATYAFPPPKPAPAPKTAPTARSIPDVAALDGVEGQVSVDATVTATTPFGAEAAFHHPLRIPIQAGSISFGELERGLSALEDAVLDFEVEGDELILELDVIPIFKFDNITLVSWSLTDPADRDLAIQKRVRLRRLLQYRLPPSRPSKRAPSDAPKKRGIQLVRLDFAPVDVSLSLPKPFDLSVGGGRLRFGTTERPSVASLVAKGALHLAHEGARIPGRIDLAISGIVAAADGVVLGPVRVARGTLEVAALEPVRVDFIDLSPRSISGTARGAIVRNVAVDVLP